MALFILQCDELNSISSSIESIASQISSLSEEVNSFDVSCEDFDFSSAKSIIASNIEACHQKVKNTSHFMQETIASHTALQTSLTNPQESNNNKNTSKTSSNSSSGSVSRGSSGQGANNVSTGYSKTNAAIAAGSTIISSSKVGTKKSSKEESLEKIESVLEENSQQETVIKAALDLVEDTEENSIIEQLQQENGTAWCSEFINYSAEKCGYENNEILPKFESANEGVEWFKKEKLFNEGDYSPKNGDIVFLDSNNDSVADTVGVITKSDKNKIYTIEAPKSSSFVKSTYDLSDKNIVGFGTPDYKKLKTTKKIKTNLNQAKEV